MESQSELQQRENANEIIGRGGGGGGGGGEEVKHSEKQSTIISANGIRIASKLNPEAKEFYPSYMRAERIKHCLKAEDEIKCDECETCIVERMIKKTLNEEVTVTECEQNDHALVAKDLDIKIEIVQQLEGHVGKEEEEAVQILKASKQLDCEIVNVEQIEAVGDVIKSTTVEIPNEPLKIETIVAENISKDDATKGKVKPVEKSQTISKSTHLKVATKEKHKDSKTTAAAKEPPKPKKDEKQSTLRKLSKIMLGSSSKTNTTDKVKTNVKTTSCSKRISESLHNLTSSLKSKTDVKTAEIGSGVMPRSSTAISRGMQIRSGTATTTTTTTTTKSSDANGMLSELTSTKTVSVSGKSTLAMEKTVASKPTTFGQSKSLHRKLHSASPSQTERSNTPVGVAGGSKLKETGATAAAGGSAPKLPRGTLSSSLRQSEAQRRRHLFPSDDPESKANIELPQFLFK